MTTEIRFGTDGWRGLIARDFTFEGVRSVAQAVCDYLAQRGEDSRVAVGYDRRFLSEDFARAAAEVFAGNGVEAFVSTGSCPTPHVSYYVHEHRLPLGVVITASHNGFRWNGFKIKERFGGSASPETTRAVQELIGASPVRSVSYAEGVASGRIVETTLDEGYGDLVRSIVDVEAIRKSDLKVVVDSMNGVGERLLEGWAASPTCRVTTLRADRDPLFGGLAPEPKEEYLNQLREAVLREGADIGLATDGDGDRSGGVRSDGAVFTPLEMVALLALYLIEVRGVRGTLAANNANTLYLRKIADEFGVSFTNLPIGFKYIADLMQKEQVIIGGEESGGIAVQGYLPERDGILINLLLLEMLVKRGKSVTDLLRDLYARYGEFHFRRRDFPLAPEVGMRRTAAFARKPPERLEGFAVEGVETLDGTKLLLAGGSWILFRQSGTEPSLRVYCEAPTLDDAERLIASGVKAVEAAEA